MSEGVLQVLEEPRKEHNSRDVGMKEVNRTKQDIKKTEGMARR